jgi:ethanolamine utilization protein EutN
MQIGRVVGQAVSTVKHASMHGWRLLVVQLLTAAGIEDGEPLLAIDNLGAGSADLVILCGEGRAARDLMGHNDAPVRWLVLGICDSWEPDGHAHR